MFFCVFLPDTTVKHRPTILAIWGKRTSRKSAEVQIWLLRRRLIARTFLLQCLVLTNKDSCLLKKIMQREEVETKTWRRNRTSSFPPCLQAVPFERKISSWSCWTVRSRALFTNSLCAVAHLCEMQNHETYCIARPVRSADLVVSFLATFVFKSLLA